MLYNLEHLLAVFSVVLQKIFGGKLPEEHSDRPELAKRHPHGSSQGGRDLKCDVVCSSQQLYIIGMQLILV